MYEQAGKVSLDRCRFCDKAATKVDCVCDEHWEELWRYLRARYSALAEPRLITT